MQIKGINEFCQGFETSSRPLVNGSVNPFGQVQVISLTRFGE